MAKATPRPVRESGLPQKTTHNQDWRLRPVIPANQESETGGWLSGLGISTTEPSHRPLKNILETRDIKSKKIMHR